MPLEPPHVDDPRIALVDPRNADYETDQSRRRAFRLACATTAIAVFGASAVSPVLPEIGRSLGVDAAEVSLLVSLFILPMAVLTPLIGLVADRLSLRPVLITCLLVYGIAGVACAFAPNFPLLLTFRILQGCGGAALELFGLVVLIESSSRGELHTAIGRNASVIGISTAAAPLISGILSLVSWRATFMSAAMAFPLALAVKLYLPTLQCSPIQGRTSIHGFLRRPVVVGALVTTLVIFLFLFGVLLSFVPEKAAEIGIRSDFVIAFVPAACAIAITVTAPLMAKLLPRLGARRIIVLSWVLYALSMIDFYLSSDILMLGLGAIALGAAHGLLFPLVQSLLANEAPSEGSVVFMSFNIAAIGIGQTVTPLLMSAIYETSGLAAVFALAIALALAMIPVTLAFFAVQRPTNIA